MSNTQKEELNKARQVTKPITINPRLFVFSLVILSGILAAAFIFFSVYTGISSFFLLAAGFTLTTLLGLLAVTKFWLAPEPLKLFLFALLFEFSIILSSTVLPSYSGFPYSIIALTIAFLITTSYPTSTNTDWVIWTGLVGAIGSILFSILAPLPQIFNSSIEIAVVILAGFFLMVLVFLLFFGNLRVNLRVKLILGALALSLIPITALALINNQYLMTSIQQQANDSLRVAAAQTSSEIDGFLLENLESVASEASLPALVDYLSLDPQERTGSPEENEVLVTIRSLQTKQKVYLPSYAILNFVGGNVIDTSQINIGKSERATSYFRQSAITGTAFVSPVEFVPGTREAYINFISPIVNPSRQVIGYLRIRYDARILQSIIEENVGLIGTRSYPILLDDNGMRLADGSSPNLVFRTISQLPTETFNNLTRANRIPSYLPQSLLHNVQEDIARMVLSDRTTDYFTTATSAGGTTFSQLGIITTLQYQPWNVVYLQDQSSLLLAINNQNRLSAIISTLIAALVAVFITIVANSFSRPIIQLTNAAEQISKGDLSVQAPVTSKDEIGLLSSSFNSMTQQLKEFIDTLENRVRERTQQLAQQYETLQFRSRQLQTVSDVARGVASSREIELLLNSVTTLISERFNFYHVGIFLVDEKNESAVLRAANSVGGRKMLARQHKLQVGQTGIVGYVTGTGEPRIATDVGQDAVFFNNPDLPETKSEMALPLRVGDRTIGALDVQSIESNAFSTEDIELFSTLADQVAIAINNNQLFEDTAKALAESERIHRQYLNQEWTRQSTEATANSYKYTPDGLVPFSEDLPEVRMVLESARPVFKSQKVTESENQFDSTLTVPILLRGESIGVIHLHETGEKPFTWSQNDLLTVQEVANQVSQSLENARLFEETIRRADRERKVLEITSKIRSTNDPQQMLQITLEELKKNLGASKAQIVFNVGELQEGQSNQDPHEDPEVPQTMQQSGTTEA